MDLSNERMQILEMIESGRISADEGLSLLQALNSSEQDGKEPVREALVEPDTMQSTLSESAGAVSVQNPPGHENPQSTGFEHGDIPNMTTSGPANGLNPAIRKWKNWWTIPLWIGTAMTVFGGLFMYLAQQTYGLGFWFICAAVPFTIGLVVIVLAWQSRTAPWLHLRVQQPQGKSPEKIAFSFPLPLRTASWFVRTFGWMIPGMADKDLDRIIEAVGENANPENPLSILVDEGESGEKVEIYIG